MSRERPAAWRTPASSRPRTRTSGPTRACSAYSDAQRREARGGGVDDVTGEDEDEESKQ